MKKTNIFAELRSFLILWGSQTVSELGTAMTNYALIVWVYEQRGDASSLTLMTVCAFLPTILFRFIAGTLADRWDKKRIMLLADLAAACGTALIFALYVFSALRLWHLYVINILLSFMNAFQVPASFVATSLLVPPRHYTRVGGLQAFGGSAVTILAPMLGSSLLALGGMTVVLLFDLASFAVAFFILLFLIKLPAVERREEKRGEPFLKSCMEGLRYLRDHQAILRLTLFLAIINFLAKMGNDGMLAPFILGRSGHNQQALGLVQTAASLGILAGSLVVTVVKPPEKKCRLIFLSCGLTCLGNVAQSLTTSVALWCAAAFGTYLSASVMNANLTALMRARVPLDMQGRVFSTKDTLQNVTIPLGLVLGGLLADGVFEPFMAKDSPIQRALSPLFGSGSGSGIAVIFLIVGVLGAALSLTRLRKTIYQTLES